MSIDYNLGTVKVMNQAIINSGVPVNVQFENNAGFGIQQRNFMGLTTGLSGEKYSERITHVGRNDGSIG